MARPPRIPVWLPLDQTVTYFITICVGGRRPVLDNPEIFGAILKICDLQEQWETVAAVVMPDHLHALVRPLANRDAKITQYSAGLKRFVRRERTRPGNGRTVFSTGSCGGTNRPNQMDLHAGKSRPRRAREALGRLAVRDRVSRVGVPSWPPGGIWVRPAKQFKPGDLNPGGGQNGTPYMSASRIPRSRICRGSTSLGDCDIRSCPRLVLGKAITSRIDSAPQRA